MNKRNDYETLLELANKDLKQYNAELHVYDPGESGEYTLEIRTLNEDGSVACFEDYAEGYYEEELGDLINEAWAHAKNEVLQRKAEERDRAKEEIKKKYSLSNEAHLLAESIQEITLNAWPVIYGPHNEYDQDSLEVLETIRKWGEEFEQWWMSHDERWRCETHDYLEEIDKFTERKCKEYLKELGVEPEPAKEEKEEPEVRGHIEERIEVIQDLMEICHDEMAEEDRAWAFETIRNWGAEFAKRWYCDMTDEDRMKMDYFEAIQKFAEAKLKTIHKRDFIVTLTRNETIEVKVLVAADDWKEAVEKVQTAWREDESFARKVLDHAEEGEVECTAHESTGVGEQVDLAL